MEIYFSGLLNSNTIINYFVKIDKLEIDDIHLITNNKFLSLSKLDIYMYKQ